MKSDSIKKPSFIAQTWRKMKIDKSVEDFHNKVNKHVESLIQIGYDVEIEWLDSNGELIQNEEYIASSITCRIIDKQSKIIMSGTMVR